MSMRVMGLPLMVGLSALLLSSSVVSAKETALKKGERIVFLGDSITQAGNQEGGYVDQVRKALAEKYPVLEIEVIGAGISGNKVPDLENRLERDVLSKKPTIVVIYIGINDVWHSTRNQGTSKERFEEGLNSIISQIQKAGARVILATPSVIGEKSDGSNSLDEMLEDYSAISRQVAKEKGVQLLDLRKQFVGYLQEHNPENQEKNILTTDGVHLNPAGNTFVAKAMLEALEVKPENAAEKGTVLRHVVLFKFKETVSEDEVQEVVDAFAALPGKIDVITDFEMGTDVSVENKSKGFTHGFVVTFADEKGRDVYLPHPAHQEFVKLVGPRIEDVLVFDYFTSP